MTDPDRALVELVTRLRSDGYAFTTVTPLTHARVNGRSENARAESLRDVFGWSRPFDAALLPGDMLALMREAGVLEDHQDGLRATVRVSSLDDGLFVHSAYPPTETDAVFFGPDTIRFVMAVDDYLSKRSAPVRRAVDIGCGSGAAGIAVAKRRREAEVTLVDINDKALRFAALNAQLAGVAVEPRRSNLLDDVEGQFDLIVSNPPFMLDATGRHYRHGGGEFGEGLALSIVEAATERLALGGTLVLFTGSCIVDGVDPFKRAAKAACERADLRMTYREFDPDAYGEELDDPLYARVERIALVVLTATREATA